tara:strand:+ start:436 stop:612 length:177 start_codon:yes stop_codon:yes gene_type:complete
MFETSKFGEFMYVLKDFEDSLHEWASKDVSNTWGMRCEISEDKYIIYLTVNEGKDKSK